MNDDEAAVSRTRRRARPKWESTARARLRRALGRLGERSEQLVSTRANESTTWGFVRDFLKAGLGYAEDEISTEHQLPSGEIADCALLLAGRPVVLIEVKRSGLRLNSRHLAQVQTCAAHADVEWAVLTNGRDWMVYRITVPDGIVSSSELTINATFGADATKDFFYLTRESIVREQIGEHWKRMRALSPQSLTRAVTSKPVLSEIRRQLHRAGGVLLDTKEIAEGLEVALLGPAEQHWSNPRPRRRKRSPATQ